MEPRNRFSPYGESITSNTGVQIRANEKVEQVRRNSAGFHISTDRGDHHAR
jgi:L-2-hydroxyglutarate oxidase LhgO